ncbi:hypothetical protein HZS_7865 [Henneguya salminicola]|nr:hypothetical protein HZS_7865 [Henneguya salminicola]
MVFFLTAHAQVFNEQKFTSYFMAGIRVLVKFTNVLNFSKLFWHYLTNENLNLYISDLIKLLLGKLYIDDDTKNYKITLEGYEIPGDQILSILREGDKINVIPCSNYPALIQLVQSQLVNLNAKNVRKKKQITYVNFRINTLEN